MTNNARTVTSIILKPCNQIRKGKDETSVTGMTRPPGVDMRRYTNNNRAQPKFKFQMKFVAASDGGMPGPLLSHPSRPNRTHYHKRKAAIKNTFCQSTVKQIQVRKCIHIWLLSRCAVNLKCYLVLMLVVWTVILITTDTVLNVLCLEGSTWYVIKPKICFLWKNFCIYH